MLVDGHEVVRRGVRAMVEADPEILVVGEARGVGESVEVAAATRPDVVITEITLADGSGVDATRRILSRRPQASVLILTSLRDEATMFASISAGASGFLLKHARSKELVRAVRTVASGRALVDPSLTGSVLERIRGAEEPPSSGGLLSLASREVRILELLGDGLTSRGIGDELHLAEATVRNYVSNILSKLGVRSRAEGVAQLARERRAQRRWGM
jgi:DNA-binding NarL/FixJ family response regulator